MRQYSEFKTGKDVKRLFKKTGQKRTPSSFEAYTQNVWSHMRRTGVMVESDMDLFLTEMQIVFHYLFGRCNHVFCESGLSEFFSSACRDVTNDYLGDMPIRGDRPKLQMFNQKPPLGIMAQLLMVHFPINEQKYSIAICQHRNTNSETGIAVAAHHGEDVFILFKDRGGDNIIDRHNGSDEKSIDSGRLVLGFTLYAECFPECLHDGFPSFAKHPSWYKGNHSHLTRNHIVEEDHARSVSAHWRRGHFAILKHKRYKKNIGKAIFRKGTFVNGKAMGAETPTF
jgi:hypothetical protein